MTMVEEDPALKRKRRIEQRRAERSTATNDDNDAKKVRLSPHSDDDSCFSVDADDEEHRSAPSVRGIKRLTRYEPGVPMTKEELQKWRKQARRVRNRESAAASRAKTRERITELEGEVSELQAELAKARARIFELEAQAVVAATAPPPLAKCEEPKPHHVSPVPSPRASPNLFPSGAPRSMLPLGFSLDSCEGPVSLLPTMISRPTAAKIHVSGEETTSTSPGVLEEPLAANEPPSVDEGTAPEDLELEDFLVEALSDYDPHLADLADLCA